VLTFTLAGHPPSPNRSVREHFHRNAAVRKVWHDAARLAAIAAMRDAGNADDYPLRRARIRLVVIAPDRRRRDPDNAIAAAKGVIDGIVDAGVLADDSFAVLAELSVASEAGPKSIRLEVTAA
jgi:Holliday junction resolvase RusA-like endonuclease